MQNIFYCLQNKCRSSQILFRCLLSIAYFGLDFENRNAGFTPELDKKQMKAIILISSIFYILGLKLGNKIDLVKKSDPVEKIITHKIKADKPDKCCDYSKETTKKTVCDTLKGGTSYYDALLKSKVF